MGCSITFPIDCDGCDNKPYIGDNGNWYVGETDTGVKAQGPAGPGADPEELERLSNKVAQLDESIGEYEYLVSHSGTKRYTTDIKNINNFRWLMIARTNIPMNIIYDSNVVPISLFKQMQEVRTDSGANYYTASYQSDTSVILVGKTEADRISIYGIK